MAFESITDVQIKDLLSSPKKITNPGARLRNIEGRDQVNYKAIATDGSGHEFQIYKRQNTREGMEDDFSCGISWVAANGETLTLKRYNGSSHSHKNQIEDELLTDTCHIHMATERYIKANKKPESFAVEADNYSTIEGALHCLVTECNISGIVTTPDNAKLF